MSGWTEERVALLKELWPEGLSARQVATKLGGGLSRNAVIGKVHRLGLAKRERLAPSKPAKAPRAISAPKAARPEKPKANYNLVAVNAAQRANSADPGLPAVPQGLAFLAFAVPFIDRRKGQCAFILDGTPQIACCGWATDGGDYCRGHKLLMSAGPGKPLNERRLMGLGNVLLRGPRHEPRTADLTREAA